MLKVDAWSEWLGWNFIASARSSLDRMFHAKGTQIFIQGNESDQIFADFVGDQETFSDDTVFTDGTGWTPVGDDSGIPIEFAWELPWFDNESRFSTKEMRAINFDTKGKAEFSGKFFVDKIYDDRSFKGEEFTAVQLLNKRAGHLDEILPGTACSTGAQLLRIAQVALQRNTELPSVDPMSIVHAG